MKKTFLFACMLLLFGLFQSQAAPTPSSMLAFQNPATWNKSTTTLVKPGVYRIQTINPLTGALTDVYARLQYENEYNSGYGLYGDVIVRFYEDASQEIPAYVSGLEINIQIIGYNGWSYYNYNTTASCSGEYTVIASGAEHDYDDGETFRYRDYHLLPGSGYIDL
ncbi:MAG TPA: hypothetical protein VF008_33010 [Niastella sp.]